GCERVVFALDRDFELARSPVAQVAEHADLRAGQVRLRRRSFLTAFDRQFFAADARDVDVLAVFAFPYRHQERRAPVGAVFGSGALEFVRAFADSFCEGRARLGEDRDHAPVFRPADAAGAVGAGEDLVEPLSAFDRRVQIDPLAAGELFADAFGVACLDPFG